MIFCLGSCWVNCHNLFDSASGFGGYRESGFGRDGGKEVHIHICTCTYIFTCTCILIIPVTQWGTYTCPFKYCKYTLLYCIILYDLIEHV